MAGRKKDSNPKSKANTKPEVEEAVLSADELKDMEDIEQQETPEVDNIPPIEDDIKDDLDDLDKMLDAQAKAAAPRRSRRKKTETAGEDTALKEAKETAPARTTRHRQSRGLPDYLPSGDLTNRASRDEKRELYREEEVFTIDPEKAAVETEQEKRRATWFKLLQAAETGLPLEGTLYSCIKAKDENGKPHVLGVVSFECATIYIPVELLFRLDEEGIRTNQNMTREQTLLNAKAYFTNLRFGMQVHFTVLRAFEKNPMNEDGGPMAYGSRLDALQRLGNDNYVRPQRADGKPLIVKGMKVEAVITCLTKRGIYVEAAGVEEFIPNDELSWRHISDARSDIEDFYVGKVILVVVKDIGSDHYEAHDRKFDLVTLSLSAKDAIPNPNRKNFNNFVVGQETLATVTMITDDGLFVMLGNNERDAKCGFPRNGDPIPPLESLIRVKITRKVEEDYKIFVDYKDTIRVGKG